MLSTIHVTAEHTLKRVIMGSYKARSPMGDLAELGEYKSDVQPTREGAGH